MDFLSIQSDGYINLNKILDDLGVKQVLVDQIVIDNFSSDDVSVCSVLLLKILITLIEKIEDTIPFKFSVQSGETLLPLVADYRLFDKSIVIDFDGEV